MNEHPGIVFVEGPIGPRAALAAFRGLDVWEVIGTLQDNDGNVADTAEFLSIPETEVRIALAYYADHRSEIDDWIRANDEEFKRGAAEARRERESPGARQRVPGTARGKLVI